MYLCLTSDGSRQMTADGTTQFFKAVGIDVEMKQQLLNIYDDKYATFNLSSAQFETQIILSHCFGSDFHSIFLRFFLAVLLDSTHAQQHWHV